MADSQSGIPDITVIVTKGTEYVSSIQPSEVYQVLVNTGDSYTVNVNQPYTIVMDGSGSYVPLADFASYAGTASLALTASYVSGGVNDWSNLTGKPTGLVSSSQQALTWTVSSASYAVTASYVSGGMSNTTWNSILGKPTGLVSSSTQIKLNEISGSTFKSSSYTFPQNLTVLGVLSASQLKVNTVIASSTGSTVFGSTSTDTHQFTGSVIVQNGITGSLTTNLITVNAGTSEVNIKSSTVSGIFNETRIIDPPISIEQFSGAAIDYSAQRITDNRSGTLFASWSGSTVSYTDVSSTDIGDAYDLSFSLIKIGNDIRLRAYSAGSGSGEWSLQFLFKLFPKLV